MTKLREMLESRRKVRKKMKEIIFISLLIIISAIVFALQLSDVPKSQNIKCFCCCDFKWVVHRHRISFIFLCNRVFNPDFSICIVLFDPFYCGNFIVM